MELATTIFATLAMGWISAHSDLPDPEYLPDIVMVDSQCMMDKLFMEDPLMECDPADPTVEAFYYQGMLHIPEDGFGSTYWKSVVVHETVHFMQEIAGQFKTFRQGDCLWPIEEPAYNLQLEWLKQHGGSASDFALVRSARASARATCP